MKALKIVGKVLGIALNAILILILLASGWTIIAKNFMKIENPTFFGVAMSVVETDSMKGDREDSIDGMDVIISVKKKEYSIDSVVVFERVGGGIPVVHRIIGWDEEAESFITQGDANNTEDEERVSQDRIIGEVEITIPKLGVAIKWLRSPLGLTIIAGSLFLLIAVPLLFGKDEE